MKVLRELLYDLNITHVIGNTNMAISSIHLNSNQVINGGLFIAIQGDKVNGHEFISDAISLGAIAILCETLPKQIINGITYIQVDNSSFSLGLIASSFFNHPSKKIKLIGVTGTNGKTSTVYYLSSLFRQLNFKVGLISTIEYHINDISYPSTHTTPNPIVVNQLLSDMVEVGCDYCFMEVSSHGIHQNRIVGLEFDIAVFSNISRDHLDYHNSFNEYIICKKKFFDYLSPTATAIVNIDDEYSKTMLLDNDSKQIYFGTHSSAHFSGHIVESTIEGLSIVIDGKELTTRLIGDFTLYNLLVTYVVALEFNQEKESVFTILSNLKPVPGRFNIIKNTHSSVTGIIDYAHSPDALEKVLISLSKFCSLQTDLVIVIGCGGDRDKGKRPLIGKLASENSFMSIFTTDNPRFEDPNVIITDMYNGVDPLFHQNVKKILNRAEAVEEAVSIAKSQSSKDIIVLVVGKGHEKYQDTCGVKTPFDDYQILQNFLKE